MPKIEYMIALILAGMVFLLLEIITPTFGLLAVLGIASFAGAVAVAFAISPVLGVIMTAGLLFLVPAYLVITVKFLPKSPLGRRLFLRGARNATGEATPEASEHKSLVGKTGVAESILRPTGAVRIEGKRVIASAESGMINRGAKIKVVRTSGTNIIVRQADRENS